MAKKQTKKITASKPKATTPKKPAAKKPESMEQTHGKLESVVGAAQDLDKILGLRQKNPFGATSKEQFEQSLSSMNLTDMREMAVTAGIFPSGNRTVLKKKLLKGFSSYCKGFENSRPTVPLKNDLSFPNSALQKEIDEIWSKK